VERLNQWLALIGNIGVIAGIFFLAYEIQANTNAVRSATYQAYNESTFSWADTVLEYSSELAEIYQTKDLAELTPEQRQVWIGFIFKAFTNMEANYLQHRAGAMDDDVFEAKMQGSVISMMCNPLWIRSWQTNSEIDPSGMTPEFRRYLDARLASAQSEIPADALEDVCTAY
jgi:hypothetical protein